MARLYIFKSGVLVNFTNCFELAEVCISNDLCGLVA